MALHAHLSWSVDGTAIDARFVALLEAIASRGSLKQAIGDVGLSYRHAWDLLGRAERALGQPLVELERGRGAKLAPLGARLAHVTRDVEKRIEADLKRAAAALGRLDAKHAKHARLSVCASHDFALAALAEMLTRRGAPLFDLHFHGSADALALLARNRCDIAGFHVPQLPGRRNLIEAYRPWLKARTLRVIHFADRRQGLIVGRGNPLHIRSLADLVRKRARFVNRQPGSGTRIFLDALLTVNRIRPAQVNGYRREEFTHAAVAAMIASGVADAGFGIEAAASQHRLGFVPLASERYFLAASSTTLERPAVQEIIAALKSRGFLNAVQKLPGYTLPPAITPLSTKQAFERL